MAEITPPPVNHPLVGADGKLTTEWIKWIRELVRIIQGL